MALVEHSFLGPYEIIAPLGTGGMGEVYRARDTRLGRDVALKVLPSSFATDAERLRRFEQEARSASALNHPNILTVFDVGVSDGAPYLVTELLEGETLRERLNASPLACRKALDLAVQLARGVAAAHDKGIIHRDLKPANIFLTHDGRVKILDFGLAKLVQKEVPGQSETLSVTQTTARAEHTQPGVVLGTVGYMSPEQVRGLPADARSDIFALGTILYEMLSGDRAFERDSSAETMAAILKEEPPELSGAGKTIPPTVDRVVHHCLEKNPAERFQSARDLAFNLESLFGASGTGTATVVPLETAPVARSKRRLLLAAAGASGLIAMGIAGYFFGRGAAVPALPHFRQLTFDRGTIYSARFSSDGQSIFYSAAWNGQPVQIYSTDPNAPESTSLNLLNSALFAVSPAEMAISIGCKDLFIADCEGILARVPIRGGTPRQMAENVVSADWAADGTEMAVIRHLEGNFRVEFPLGKVVYQSGGWLDFVRVSPDGKMVAFAEFSGLNADVGRVAILDATGKRIAESPVSPSVEGIVWRPGSSEVWFATTDTGAWANKLQSLSLAGRTHDLLRLPGMLRLHDISRDGRILFSSEIWTTSLQFRGLGETKERDLSWLDDAFISDLSADGSNIVFDEAGASIRSGEFQAEMRSTDGSSPVRLGRANSPVFSPDGKWILASAVPFTKFLIWPTGAGEVKEIQTGGIQQSTSMGWMPDGKQFYFAGNDGHSWRIYVQDIAGGAARAITPAIIPKVEAAEANLVSPDGKYIFARDLNSQGLLYPLGGGAPKSVRGFLPTDIWSNWTTDGRAAYVYQNMKTHGVVFRLDLATGERKPVLLIAPQDPSGVNAVAPIRITRDGRTYAYSYNRSLSNLFVADGVK
jgi:Tol biopolymer transport system component